jgi:predicted kinase
MTIPNMASRVKRTYNLAPRTVRRVREMAERYGVAPSQDAVIELAVDELERRIREQQETDAWAQAAADPEFQREAEEVAAAYRSADRDTWPA